MVPNNETNILGTTVTSIKILQLIKEMNGARVSEIAERMQTPKSTIHGHLMTLKSEEFVIKKGDVYCLGPELLRLGYHVRTRKEGLVLAREFTEKLFEETGFRSTFAVEMGGKAVFIHTASGSRMGWAHERHGSRLYLHNTSFGKAILAEMPRVRVEQILDRHGTPQETEHTITDREVLLSELETIHEQGYAVNNEENIKDLYAIGVAATEQSGNVIGGFSITGPENSFTNPEKKQQLIDTITEIVNEYELELSLA